MEKKKKKIWKKISIILGVIVALLAIIFIGYKIYDYIDKETKYKEFEKNNEAIVEKLLLMSKQDYEVLKGYFMDDGNK